MFQAFFYALRQNGFGVGLHEYITLLEGLSQKDLVTSIDDFYAFAKTVFVRDESQLDRFDLLFDTYIQGARQLMEAFFKEAIPADWLEKMLADELSEEQKQKAPDFGGLDNLMDRFKELLDEQKEAHHGGDTWIGTGGTSPFGHGGVNPEGFRLGGEGGQRKAIKVWERRDFKNLDDRVTLNTRNLKMIFKRLRFWTRQGVADEFDLDQTIRKTADNGGMLDIAMQPPRKNKVKVLMLMDIGGSMDSFVALCEQLFSAARWEFKHLEFYYFHNCVYESVWKDNNRRYKNRLPTLELLRKFSPDYKLIFVGDAAMSPYELHYKGGSVEHYNDESGLTWLNRRSDHFSSMIWINPTPEYEWDYYETTTTIRKYTGSRMFPMTADGLVKGMQCLQNPHKTYKNQIWGEI